jgi:hypothetical protein
MEKRFKEQQVFTEDVLTKKGAKFPLTEEDQVKWSKEYVLNLLSELNDLLNQLDWKSHWSNHSTIIKSNVGIEIVDLQKYVWGLTKIWGFSEEDFLKYYDMKTAMVTSKWGQENLLGTLAKCDKVCVIDIDGVLATYPEFFLDWVKNTYNEKIDKKDVIKWEHYKHLYRESGIKSVMPFITDSRKALKKLYDLGYVIVLLTNRPASKYQRIYGDTLNWLQSSQMPYDYIFWAADKKILEIAEKCKNIKFVVDDNKETCKEFNSAGIKAYQYGKDIKNLLDIDELKEKNNEK